MNSNPKAHETFEKKQGEYIFSFLLQKLNFIYASYTLQLGWACVLVPKAHPNLCFGSTYFWMLSMILGFGLGMTILFESDPGST